MLRYPISSLGLKSKKSPIQPNGVSFLGCKNSEVSSVERGKRNLSLENIGKLAKALECTIGDLVSFLK